MNLMTRNATEFRHKGSHMFTESRKFICISLITKIPEKQHYFMNPVRNIVKK